MKLEEKRGVSFVVSPKIEDSWRIIYYELYIYTHIYKAFLARDLRSSIVEAEIWRDIGTLCIYVRSIYVCVEFLKTLMLRFAYVLREDAAHRFIRTCTQRVSFLHAS